MDLGGLGRGSCSGARADGAAALATNQNASDCTGLSPTLEFEVRAFIRIHGMW